MRGLLWMTLAVLTIPASDAIAKILSESLSVTQIATTRFVIAAGLLFPLWLFWRQKGIWLQGLTQADWALGGLIAASILFLFWGLSHLPLANNIAIFFVEPLILVVFSRLFLRETISRKRWLAVIVGLIGAMIVIRPNLQAYGWATLLPLLAATAYAGYLTLTRVRAAGTDPKDWQNGANGLQKAVRLQLMVSICASVLLTGLMVIGQWSPGPLTQIAWPTFEAWAGLLLLGFLAAFAHVLIAIAMSQTDASVLAPLQYLEILGAVIFGWWLFGHWPDTLTWLGMGIIIAAGLYVVTEKPSPPLIED